MSLATDIASIRDALRSHGLLLLQDPALPNVARIIATEAIRGSWWSHPAGKRIFNALSAIEHELLSTRLVAGKVTFVDRPLWPAACAIGEANASWQLDALPTGARALRVHVTTTGIARADELAALGTSKEVAKLALELEKRFLVVGHSEHTERGAHQKVIETWQHWAERMHVTSMTDAECAKRQFEERIRAWKVDPHGLLPWLPKKPRR